MLSLETLKQELIYQKGAVEAKGGTVQVAGSNPSPSEITAGINSIESLDVHLATAVETDVLEGKTFFAGDRTLKTGVLSATNETTLDEVLRHTLVYNTAEPTSTKRYTVTIPSYIINLRNYFMKDNPNYLDIYLHPDIEKFEGYTFANCVNSNIYGFDNMPKLSYVGISTFQNCNPECFDLGNIPNNIGQILSKAFQNVPCSGRGLNLPFALTNLGTYAFSCDERVDVSSFSFNASGFLNTSLVSYCFQNIGAHADFYVPDITLSIGSGFNYGGCFDNVSFGLKVKSIGDNAFGSADTDPIENFYLKTATFHNPTPPTSLGNKIFAIQNLEHDFKIFVPDSSLEEYKALSKLSTLYGDRIFPISEKD